MRLMSNLLTATAVLAFVMATAVAGTTDLDPSFGQQGIEALPAINYGTRQDVVNSAQTLVSGASYVLRSAVDFQSAPSWTVYRLKADGSVDAGFAANGLRITNSSSPDYLSYQGLLVDESRRRLMLVGRNSTGPVIDAYSFDGTADKGFGAGGRLQVESDTEGAAEYASFDSAGRILVAIHSNNVPTTTVTTIELARVLANGTLDTTFGDAGLSRMRFASRLSYGNPIAPLELGPGGGIVVALQESMGYDPGQPGPSPPGGSGARGTAVVRFPPNGFSTTQTEAAVKQVLATGNTEPFALAYAGSGGFRVLISSPDDNRFNIVSVSNDGTPTLADSAPAPPFAFISGQLAGVFGGGAILLGGYDASRHETTAATIAKLRGNSLLVPSDGPAGPPPPPPASSVTAVDDDVSLNQDTSVVLDVTANDGDFYDRPLSIRSVGTPSSGAAVIEDNRIRFTPAAGFTGNDAFSYVVGDNAGSTATATVHLTVNDTVPDAFRFDPANNADPGSINTSNVITVNGVAVPTSVAISGGSYSLDGGAFVSTPVKVQNGDYLAVRVTASTTFNASVSATLSIGGVSASYRVTTRAGHTTPTPFSFRPATNAALGSLVTSDSILVLGTEAPAAISISGGRYSINSGAFTNGLGAVVNAGDSVRVQQLASSEFGATSVATLTIDTVSAAFSVTTAAADTNPDAFSFASRTGVPLNSVQTSAPITVGGINAPASISVVGGSYSINGGPFVTTPSTVVSGVSVVVRQTASRRFNTASTVTLSIGGVTGSFTVTTRKLIGN